MGWSTFLEAVGEWRDVDRQRVEFTPHEDNYGPEPIPTEARHRVRAGLKRFFGDRSGVELTGGFERTNAFDHQSGANRTNLAVLVRVWRTF